MVEPTEVLGWLAANERTQVWLAAKAGITSSHLNHWLTGRHAMSANTLARVASVMGLVPAPVLPAGTSDGGAA